jgi:HK97 family phage major capsid protein
MEKKTTAQLEAEKKARKNAIEVAEKAYNEFEVTEPTDIQKSFDLLKSIIELKGADEVKNFDEKIAAIEAASIEAKEAKEAELKTIGDRLEATIKALDIVQARVKADRNSGTATPSTKTFAELLSENINEKASEITTLKKGQSTSFEMKDMSFATAFSTAGSSVAFSRPGIIELPKRKLHIRQLLTGGNMGAKSTFDYVKEVTGSGSIAPVAEATLKPQIELALQEVSVKAEWIAGWLRISRNMLDDVTGMTTFLQSRLPELLLRAEDNQLLNGTGTSPQLSGITDAGNFTAPNSGYTIDVEQLVGAVAQLEGYDREANGILLNPADWYRIWLTKSTGSVAGLYNLPTELISRVGDQMFIAGVPVFRSTAIAVDKFIVGDWAMGANFILREAPRVEFFYEDGVNVRENMVTVRIEERVAFPIYGDNYFIYGDFGNVS